MTVDEENQCYTGKVILNQTGMVKVKAVVESGHFRNDRKETGYITFNVKNRPVTKVKDLEDLNMGFGEEQTIDLNTYFTEYGKSQSEEDWKDHIHLAKWHMERKQNAA